MRFLQQNTPITIATDQLFPQIPQKQKSCSLCYDNCSTTRFELKPGIAKTRVLDILSHSKAENQNSHDSRLVL